MENIVNVEALSGLTLVDINGRAFSTPPSFLVNHSRSLNGSIVGVVRRGIERLMFIGMDTSVIGVIVRQAHEEIVNWVSIISGRREIEILINPDEFEDMRPEGDRSDWQRVVFDITVNKSGLVLGVASIPS